MSFLQAQAAPASPCDPSQRGHARRPLGDELASDHRLFEAATSASRRPDPSSDPDLDPGAALLLRVEPTRAARQGRSVGDRGRTEARQARAATQGTDNAAQPVSPAATELRPGPPPSPIAAREGEGPKPSAHRAGLARLREAALAVTADSHLTRLKAAASDSRPPELGSGHNGTPGTEVSTERRTTDLHPTPSTGRSAGGEGEGERCGGDHTSALTVHFPPITAQLAGKRPERAPRRAPRSASRPRTRTSSPRGNRSRTNR